jgi:hypothetical protein
MTDPAATAAASTAAEPRRPPRRWVIAGCIAAALLFLGTMSLLCVHWIRGDNPNAMIVIEADASLGDATVVLKSLDDAGAPPLLAPIKNGNEYRVRFRVPPGRYRVSVSQPAGLLLPPREITLDPLKPGYLLLGHGPSTEPAGRP